MGNRYHVLFKPDQRQQRGPFTGCNSPAQRNRSQQPLHSRARRHPKPAQPDRQIAANQYVGNIGGDPAEQAQPDLRDIKLRRAQGGGCNHGQVAALGRHPGRALPPAQAVQQRAIGRYFGQAVEQQRIARDRKRPVGRTAAGPPADAWIKFFKALFKRQFDWIGPIRALQQQGAALIGWCGFDAKAVVGVGIDLEPRRERRHSAGDAAEVACIEPGGTAWVNPRARTPCRCGRPGQGDAVSINGQYLDQFTGEHIVPRDQIGVIARPVFPIDRVQVQRAGPTGGRRRQLGAVEPQRHPPLLGASPLQRQGGERALSVTRREGGLDRPARQIAQRHRLLMAERSRQHVGRKLDPLDYRIGPVRGDPPQRQGVSH